MIKSLASCNLRAKIKNGFTNSLLINLPLDAVRFTRDYIGGEKKLRKRIFLSFTMKNNTISRFFARILNYCKDYIDCLFKHINVAINLEAITSSKLTQVTELLAIMSKSKHKFCILNKH